jgi:DNA-binding SARP family transcriptional activator
MSGQAEGFLMAALVEEARQISVYTFGNHYAQADGRIINPPSNLLRILVHVLLEGKGKPVLRKRIRDLIWSENPSEKASSDIRQAVARLRKYQESHDFKVLSADAERVWLNVDQNIYVDLAEFMDLLADPQPKSCVRLCEIYHGELLVLPGAAAGKGFEDWLGDQRATLLRRFSTAVARALESPSALTSHERHFCASRLLQIDPCHEGAHRALMYDAAAKGQFSLVKQLFNTYSKQLHEELGVGPDQETVRLYQTLTSRSPNGP